jgi:hypothetical protein
MSPNIRSAVGASLDTLFAVADRARARRKLSPEDVVWVAKIAPDQLNSLQTVKLPASIKHPTGFSVSGASVRTFVQGALLVAGQKALGRRFGASEFYERVERDLAFGIMRSNFHLGYPKGVYCCVQCTLATIPVLDAGAIRYFDCGELSRAAKLLIQKRQWRFAKRVDSQMLRWALGSGGTIE